MTNCDSYRPVVFENQPPGTRVLTVAAEDSDTGDNGNVTYSIVKTGEAVGGTYKGGNGTSWDCKVP